MTSKRKVKGLLCIMLIMVILTGCKGTNDSLIFEYSDDTDEGLNEDNSVSGQELYTEALTGQICVHICGAVINPGVYWLPEDSRVCEAILAAGGALPEAASDYINMARELLDGERIYLPTIDELASQEMAVNQSGEGSLQGFELEDGLININTADTEALTSIPGIGESRARDIVSYREKNGLFKSIEDIMLVPGIKENTFSKIKFYIKVK